MAQIPVSLSASMTTGTQASAYPSVLELFRAIIDREKGAGRIGTNLTIDVEQLFQDVFQADRTLRVAVLLTVSDMVWQTTARCRELSFSVPLDAFNAGKEVLAGLFKEGFTTALRSLAASRGWGQNRNQLGQAGATPPPLPQALSTDAVVVVKSGALIVDLDV
jgi:hypothetical protein